MSQDIQVGDLVQLKSGGPVMVVERSRPESSPPVCYCRWANGTEVKGLELPWSILDKVLPNGRKAPPDELALCEVGTRSVSEFERVSGADEPGKSAHKNTTKRK